MYAASPEKKREMEAAGVPIAGSLDDLLSAVDVIVDSTPKGVGARNLERYQRAGVNAIFQGGESHELAGHSFVAQINYETALGRDATRVVSCNTTSIVRTLGALRDRGLLEKARGVLIRRATDPWESDHGGIMNTVVPEPHIPSHEAIVVPENVDAVRALATTVKHGEESIGLTDRSLGVTRDFLTPGNPAPE